MFGIKPDELSAYATLATLIVGGIAFLREIRHTTTVHQIDLMLKFDEIFNSPQTRQDRLAACHFLQEKRPYNPTDDEWDKLSPILDFFQGIGTYAKARGLPLHFIHKNYFYWFSHYWFASQPYILNCQVNTPILWRDAAWLHQRLEQFDRKHNAAAYCDIKGEKLDDFLNLEQTSLTLYRGTAG